MTVESQWTREIHRDDDHDHRGCSDFTAPGLLGVNLNLKVTALLAVKLEAPPGGPSHWQGGLHWQVMIMIIMITYDPRT